MFRFSFVIVLALLGLSPSTASRLEIDGNEDNMPSTISAQQQNGTAVQLNQLNGEARFAQCAIQISEVDQENVERDKKLIRDHIDSIFQAYISKDQEAIKSSRTTGWVGFRRTSTSVLRSKADYMNGITEESLKQSRLVGYRIVDIEFVFKGDLALVPYIAELEIKDTHFKPQIRVFDVYSKESGGWIQIGAHTSTHPGSVPPNNARRPKESQ